MADVRQDSFIPTEDDPFPDPTAPFERKRQSFNLRNWLASEPALRTFYYAFGFVFIALVFRKLQYATASVCCGDFDGYYHIRWSRMLWDNLRSGHVLPPSFTWLPLTTLDQSHYVDQHFLFHLLQVPFTWFFELTTAAKLSAFIFATLAVYAVYWLIVHYRVSYPLIWVIALLASSHGFLYRMSMAKAPPLAIIFTVIGIYFLFEEKYNLLLPLMFLFVWAYSLFPLLWIAALIWTGVIAWSELRFEWRPLAYASTGIAAGLLINPYFPRDIVLLVSHGWMKLHPGGFPVDTGQEWYPYESWELFKNCFLAFVAMIAGYIAFNWQPKERARRPLFLLVFATVMMIGAFMWRRFVEYWPPFAVLFAAFSLHNVFSLYSSAMKMPDDFLRDLSPYLDRPGVAETNHWERRKEMLSAYASLVVGALVFIFLLANVAGLAGLSLPIFAGYGNEIKNETPPPDRYERSSAWMRANIPAGERIFNTDWDDFPKLFFYDSTHTYVSGLDLNYLYDKDHDLYALYRDITTGKNLEDGKVKIGNELLEFGPVLKDRFGARYVFSDLAEVHLDFRLNALDSGWFDLVYEGDDAFILKLRDQKGQAPAEPVDMTKLGTDTGTESGDDAGNDGDDETTPEENANGPK